jgi:hypothetical protein
VKIVLCLSGLLALNACGRIGFDPLAPGILDDGGQAARDGSMVDAAIADDGGCLQPSSLDQVDCAVNLSCAQPAICSGLVALLHFDQSAAAGETATLAHDFSGLGNHAKCTAPDCPVFKAGGGKFGGAYQFVEPSNFSIANSASVSISGAVTMSAWFYPTTLDTNWRIIITKLQEVPLRANYGIPHNGGTFYVNYNATSGWQNHGSSTVFTPGQWYHLVGIIDDTGDRAQLYVNGVLEHDMPETTPMEEETGSVWIGWSPTNAGVDGFIDEVAIWDRVLTPAEIAGLYP